MCSVRWRRREETGRLSVSTLQEPKDFPPKMKMLLLTGEVMTLMSTAVAGFSIWN